MVYCPKLGVDICPWSFLKFVFPLNLVVFYFCQYRLTSSSNCSLISWLRILSGWVTPLIDRKNGIWDVAKRILSFILKIQISLAYFRTDFAIILSHILTKMFLCIHFRYIFINFLPNLRLCLDMKYYPIYLNYEICSIVSSSNMIFTLIRLSPCTAIDFIF